MKKKIIMGFGALIVVGIIVLAIILCLKIFKDENQHKQEQEQNLKQDVNIYGEQFNVSYRNDQAIKNDKQNAQNSAVEIISTNDTKIQYNKVLNKKYGVIMQNLLKCKGFGTPNFESGKFSDEQKFSAIVSEIDFKQEVELYDSPAYMVSMDAIQKASLKLFEEKIDISNLKNITIYSGKVKYYMPSCFEICVMKAKSLIYDEVTGIYDFKFDVLDSYNSSFLEISQDNVIEYNKNQVLGTFQIKYKKDKNNNTIVLELNKI